MRKNTVLLIDYINMKDTFWSIMNINISLRLNSITHVHLYQFHFISYLINYNFLSLHEFFFTKEKCAGSGLNARESSFLVIILFKYPRNWYTVSNNVCSNQLQPLKYCSILSSSIMYRFYEMIQYSANAICH